MSSFPAAIAAAIKAAAAAHRIDPALVAAIVTVESGGRTWSTRHEPDFLRPRDEKGEPRRDKDGNPLESPALVAQAERFARATGVSFVTELVHEKTSWGLLQVMGCVARELGFRGHLPELCQPEVGLELGCAYLRKLARTDAWVTFSGELAAKYNGGPGVGKTDDGRWTNESYVRQVARAWREHTTAGIW